MKPPIQPEQTVGRLDVLILRALEVLGHEFIRQNQVSIRRMEKTLEPLVAAVRAAAEVEQSKRGRRVR